MLHAELTDAIAARIQKEVGTFLGLKQTLMSLQQAQDPMVQTKANQLLQTQVALEDQLKDTLQRIDNIKSGAYTASDMVVVGSFATAMENQIRAVRALGPGGGVGSGLGVAVGIGVLAVVGLGLVMAARRG